MAGIRVDNLVEGNVVMHQHEVEDVTHAVDDRGDTRIKVDTRANILASTATAGKIAFATDTEEYFIADGTNWNRSPIPFGQPSTGVDIGALSFNDDYGYGIKDLSSKNLHNIVMKDFTAGVTQLEKGAFRYNGATSTLELYNGTAWLTVITLTTAQVQDWMLRSQWNTFSVQAAPSSDTTARTVMTLGFVDIGAIPSDVILDGGILL